jgi:hypothetical protein
MVVLRFQDDRVWRDCCDPVHMRRRWGAERTRRIALRLQQLAAMTALSDLSFLPFHSRVVDGCIEVEVCDDLVLLLDAPETTSHDGVAMVSVGIRSLAVPSKEVSR